MRARDSRPACTSPDRIRAAGLTADPMELAQGEAVAIVFRIQNRCRSGTAALTVPWRIEFDSVPVFRGRTTIEAGTTTEIHRTWASLEGTYRLAGTANLPDQLAERDLANNRTADVPVTVGPPPTPAVTLEQRVLTYAEALEHGALFTHNIDAPVPACRRVGVFDPHDMLGVEFEASALFSIHCPLPLRGARASPEVFVDFRLKNGWVVKSDSTSLYIGVPEQFRWEVRPGERGADNPYGSARIWADAMHPGLAVFLFVTIEGPVGTDPF